MKSKFAWFIIVVFGVILFGMPAVYAADGAVDEEYYEDDDYDADSSDPIYSLGDTDKDLVYTPVKPCRIVDTRKAGGKISSGDSRAFYVYGGGAQMIGQGGNPAGCKAPSGEPRAVHINIVAVNSVASGWLTVWPTGTGMPLAGVLNYYPGRTDPISNAFTVKIGAGMARDINVYAHKSTHVVSDVMGYYYEPEATQLSVQQYKGSKSVASGNVFVVYSPKCKTGYIATGGGCATQYGGNKEDTAVSRPYPDTGVPVAWECRGINNESYTQVFDSHVICVRMPGR
jgi:hypothetical protein